MRRPLRWLTRQGTTPVSDDLRLLTGQSAIFAQRSASTHMRRLWDAEVSVFSQFGEDGILDLLCEVLDIPRPRIVEFGAGDFTECNSRYLAEVRNASVLAVDARKELQSSIEALDIRWRSTVLPRVEWITPASAPVALDYARAKFNGVDIVSLDIDGNDYWVAESLSLEDVKVVVVEFNGAFGHEHAVTVPRDDQFDRSRIHYSLLYYGASLRAFIVLLASKGLTFVGTNRACNNAFFVRGLPTTLPFCLPDIDASMQSFTDVRIREGRHPDGLLSLRHPRAVLRESPDLPLVDIITGTATTVGAVLGESRSSIS